MAKIIISLVTIILSIAFMFLYVMPAYSLANERRADIESLTKVLSTSGEIRKLIDKTKRNLSSVEFEGLSRFKVFLPEKVDTVRFANNLQHIGKKNNVLLSDIKVEAQAGSVQNKDTSFAVNVVKEFVNKVSLDAKINQAENVSMQGAGVNESTTTNGAGALEKKYVTTKASFAFTSTHETFQLFLNDLEKSLGLINVTSLSFSLPTESMDTKKSKTPLSPTYQYLMIIETYSLK